MIKEDLVQKQRSWALFGCIFFLILVVCVIAVLSYHSDPIDPYLQSDMVENPISARRSLIETEYPEFHRFEQRNSFAGRTVLSEDSGKDYYFAYIVQGSGIPIAQATCFRVDHMGRAFKVGIFPDPLDSYIGYDRIDLKTCYGIKPNE